MSTKPMQSEPERMRGKVLSFNLDRGFGWIKPFDGSRDVFLHRKQAEASGLVTISIGALVEYSLKEGRDGKVSAHDIKLVEMAK